MKVTNTSRDQTLNFTNPDGSTVSIKPGESADLDDSNPQVRAQLDFGSLAADEGQKKGQSQPRQSHE
jgi:hypothetical protein